MARNGAGTYSLPLAAVVPNATILAAWANTSLDDVAAALTNSLAKNGETNPTANLPMNGFKITGMANGTGPTDAMAFGQLPALFSPFVNRLINGDVRIDQANGGVAVTVNSTGTFYGPDAWGATGESTSVPGVFTFGRSTATPPAGFTHFLRATVTTADAAFAANQSYVLNTKVEGFDAADLGFGAAGAATLTLSFWVRSSIAGTFSGSVRNGTNARSRSFSYTISAANTWEYKTVTLPGDVTGTWPTDNTQWGNLTFSLGADAAVLTAAGTWVAGSFVGATGSVNLIQTNGATLDLTGVQLERGTAATDFERTPIIERFARCARQYQRFVNGEIAERITAPFVEMYGYMSAGSTVQHVFPLVYPMRSTPTATRIGTWTLSLVTVQPAFVPNQLAFQVTSTKDAATGAYQVTPAASTGYQLDARL